jgi:hypothetical protein
MSTSTDSNIGMQIGLHRTYVIPGLLGSLEESIHSKRPCFRNQDRILSDEICILYVLVRCDI